MTNPSRITIPSGKGGYYEIKASANWQSNATGGRQIQIRKNGSSSLLNIEYFGSAANEISQSISTLANLSATDYIEVRMYQTSGGNLICGLNDYYFEAHYLGA